MFEDDHNIITGAGLYRNEDGSVTLLGPADILPTAPEFSSGFVRMEDPA